MRERERERGRQTDNQAGRQTDIWIYGQKETETDSVDVHIKYTQAKKFTWLVLASMAESCLHYAI